MFRIFLEIRNKRNSVSFVLFYASELVYGNREQRNGCMLEWGKTSTPDKCAKQLSRYSCSTSSALCV